MMYHGNVDPCIFWISNLQYNFVVKKFVSERSKEDKQQDLRREEVNIFEPNGVHAADTWDFTATEDALYNSKYLKVGL